jgi:hypothetical protein
MPRFEDYPATVELTGKPALPDLTSHPQARTYRTGLRQAAAAGPNFAGHYALASFGCGTACTLVGFVNLRTGKVLFPEALDPVSFPSPLVDDPRLMEMLDIAYRPHSELLVIGGIASGQKKAGSYYYRLRDDRLRLVAVEHWGPEWNR